MVWHNDLEIPKSDLIVLPGGFSYGDYLRGGAMADPRFAAAGVPALLRRTEVLPADRYKPKPKQPRGAADLPPLLLIPPVGVGIDRQFYARFQDAWDGGDTHAPALLRTGDAKPKPRRFYKPEVWAGQLDAYVREVIGEPCVLVSQGGLLPVALEMWRLGGTDTVRGVACLSPPPLSFVASEGAAQCPDQ